MLRFSFLMGWIRCAMGVAAIMAVAAIVFSLTIELLSVK